MIELRPESNPCCVYSEKLTQAPDDSVAFYAFRDSNGQPLIFRWVDYVERNVLTSKIARQFLKPTPDNLYSRRESQ